MLPCGWNTLHARLMKFSGRLLLGAVCLLVGEGISRATLLAWEGEVLKGTIPVKTLFTTVSNGNPQVIDVGALTGDRSFEFIYNAGIGGPSQALLGSQDPLSGRQGLKVDQYLNTGMYGMTDFGVADYTSIVPYILNEDVDIVFTSDGIDTLMYVNGALADTYSGVDLTITGLNGIGGGDNATHTGFFDVLAGDIFGFASYDAVLSPAEVAAHHTAFAAAVPEPTSAGLLVLGTLLAGVRRRRS